MLSCADAALVIGLDLTMVNEIGSHHGFPIVRVGPHTGVAVERDGNWHGVTVNLTAHAAASGGGGRSGRRPRGHR